MPTYVGRSKLAHANICWQIELLPTYVGTTSRSANICWHNVLKPPSCANIRVYVGICQHYVVICQHDLPTYVGICQHLCWHMPTYVGRESASRLNVARQDTIFAATRSAFSLHPPPGWRTHRHHNPHTTQMHPEPTQRSPRP